MRDGCERERDDVAARTRECGLGESCGLNGEARGARARAPRRWCDLRVVAREHARPRQSGAKERAAINSRGGARTARHAGALDEATAARARTACVSGDARAVTTRRGTAHGAARIEDGGVRDGFYHGTYAYWRSWRC